MGDWLKNNPIGSQLINLALAILIMLAIVLRVKHKYFDISIDTNMRMRNIERYVVPDSLIYFATDTL